MPKLVVLSGEPLEYELSDKPVSIGRLGFNDIQISDGSISKQHARVVPTPNGWQIEDLNSSNGTFVNDQRITTCDLQPGATIWCGSIELRFEDDADATPPQAEEAGRQILASISVLPQSLLQQTRATEQSDTVKVVLGPQANVETEHPAERKLRLIQIIGEKSIKTLEPENLADEILSVAIQQTNAARGFICLFDDGGGYAPIATRGLRDGQAPRISRTVVSQLLNDKSGVLIKQVSEDDGQALASLKAMSVESTLCVPLWTTDKIMGFISLDRIGVGRGFETSDLELMIAVAHQAAIGIERGRLAKAAAQELNVRSYLSQYLDGKLVQHIVEGDGASGEDPFAAKEREVTILFSDIVSFTKMSEGLQPTDVSKFVRDYLTSMTEIIFAHGGTIDKYIGDAVMALFGAPVECENASRDAINAALEMRNFVENMNPPATIKDPLRVRFGISTGKAVVGNIGSAQRVEYTALGDTVNVASRLEAFARPKEICIDEVTYNKVAEEDFGIQEIGAIDVKNRAQPIRVYKVLG